MKRLFRSLTFALVALLPTAGNAQVAITEIMAQTGSAGRYAHEWIEIANVGTDGVDLTGYSVWDSPYRYTFPATEPPIALEPGQYLLLHGRNQTTGYAQGYDGVDANFTWHCFIGGEPGTSVPPHGTISLLNTGDHLGLYDANGTLLDWIAYDGAVAPTELVGIAGVATIDPGVDDSITRCETDLTALALVHFVDSSPGFENICPATPTPSPLPTDTLPPTETPTPTPTPSPTATPTPTLPPCCSYYTRALSPGWNLFAYQAAPEFGTKLLTLQQQLLAQGVPVRYLALWENGGWYIRGPAAPIPIPSTKMIPSGSGVMILCTSSAPFSYLGCLP